MRTQETLITLGTRHRTEINRTILSGKSLAGDSGKKEIYVGRKKSSVI